MSEKYDHDSKTNVHEIKEKIRRFCEAREWDQYHTPKELAIGLITESAELLDIFRFKSDRQIEEMFNNNEKREKIADELADVLYFILRFAQKYDVDLTTELNKKLEQNQKKYPVEKAKGSNKKYSEF